MRAEIHPVHSKECVIGSNCLIDRQDFPDLCTPEKWIQGLVAHWDNERRIYVVTITPEMEDAVHERWPRIMSG